MLYLIYRTNSAPFVRAKDTSLHNNYNRYLPFPQGLFLICEKLSKIGHEDRRPLAKDGYPKDKSPDLSASRFEDQGAFRIALLLHQRFTGEPQLHAGIGVDRVVNAAVVRHIAAGHAGVCCVDNGVAFQRGDISLP